MAKTNITKLYYAQKCSVTVQLERLNPEFDGMQQLADAIRRLLIQWDDVWGDFRIQISDSRTTTDWANENLLASLGVKTTKRLGSLIK
jgi:hypothetical protein